MKRCALAFVGAALMAPAAMADLDWGFLSTAGSPDPVSYFDLATPGTSVTGAGFVDGNFNRGMDFDSPDSFYYFVSTDTLNDPGDRGLWYWDNGANSQLLNIGFSDTGDGDATLSNDGSRFFVAVDDGDATSGDSLYVFDNLNGAVTFTEIGETGLEQLIGIAMDPVSGQIYGYDSGTEGLYTISATDGSASLVGSSGMSIGSIGGMDFSADGSTLLLAAAGELFTIDTGNGLFTAAGDVSLNTSALGYRGVIPAPSALALLALAGIGRRRSRG